MRAGDELPAFSLPMKEQRFARGAGFPYGPGVLDRRHCQAKERGDPHPPPRKAVRSDLPDLPIPMSNNSLLQLDTLANDPERDCRSTCDCIPDASRKF